MPVLDPARINPPLEAFLQQLLRLARLDLKFQIRSAPANESDTSLTSPELVVEFSGPDTDLLLQRGGELLEALEYMAARHLRLRAEEQSLLAFDCGDFKSLRMEELRLTAVVAAERVARTGTPFALQPMNARERRTVHMALKENAAIRTESQGFAADRKVVIFPSDKKP